jgi:hypothetical protein
MKAPTIENIDIAPMKLVTVVDALATPMCNVLRKYPTKFSMLAMFAMLESHTKPIFQFSNKNC